MLAFPSNLQFSTLYMNMGTNVYAIPIFEINPTESNILLLTEFGRLNFVSYLTTKKRRSSRASCIILVIVFAI